MLKSNWSNDTDSLKAFGCSVIRQRVGKAPRRKSNRVHEFMDSAKRAALCMKLEGHAVIKV